MKTDLIVGLKKAIYALQKNTVFYDWSNQASCNCGIVAQALTNLSPQEVDAGFFKIRGLYQTLSTQGKFVEHTWREGVRQTCSGTGKSNVEILQLLFNAGLQPEDIIHLEYLENPAILAESGIDVTAKTYKEESIPKAISKIAVPYYAQKKNLILYLQAWIRILEKEPDTRPADKLNKIELQERLLTCEYNENYEEAAQVRDLLLTIK